MKNPKGKTPSLISGSSGKPAFAAAGKLRKCNRCSADIPKGVSCVDVPKPGKAFATKRPYCFACFRLILEESKKDIVELETLLGE